MECYQTQHENNKLVYIHKLGYGLAQSFRFQNGLPTLNYVVSLILKRVNIKHNQIDIENYIDITLHRHDTLQVLLTKH